MTKSPNGIRVQELEAQLSVRELEIKGVMLIIDSPDATTEVKLRAIDRRKKLVEERAQIRRLLMRRNNAKS